MLNAYGWLLIGIPFCIKCPFMTYEEVAIDVKRT